MVTETDLELADGRTLHAYDIDPAEVAAPALFVHGGRDRVVPCSHGEWLARRVPSAELWLRSGEGHISILNQGAAAMGWLRKHAERS